MSEDRERVEQLEAILRHIFSGWQDGKSVTGIGLAVPSDLEPLWDEFSEAATTEVTT